MFPGKFFMASPPFYIEVQTPEPPRPLRFPKFWAFVHTVLVWFETRPELESVKLVAIALVESEKVQFSVWIRHHFMLHTAGAPDLAAGFDPLDLLPYSAMGNGVFELTRNDPDVQAFLSLVARDESGQDLELDYLGLVAKLGFRVDAAFEPCSIQHDIGQQKFAK